MHGAVEFMCGLAMMLAPPLLSFDVAGWIVSILLGAILTGTALGLTASRVGSVASHIGFDGAFRLATAIAALALAAAGQMRAVIFLAAVVVALAGLSFTTSYVAADS